jgi:uncharacterized phage-associated protein
VADYILWFAHETGDCITNLKLQKLVYYAQAWCLALHGKPLFSDSLQAWVHGPVQPELYQRFRCYRYNPIAEDVHKPDLPASVEKHLNEIMAAFGGFTAYDLERMVHAETPWLAARKGLPADVASTAEIDMDEMKSFYRALADGKDKQKNTVQ